MRKVQVELTDDLDGSEATGTFTFALDRDSYEIDLSEKNHLKLMKSLKPYVDAGRKARGSRPVRHSVMSAPDPAVVRAWAAEHGYVVSQRGRIPKNVMNAYNAEV